MTSDHSTNEKSQEDDSTSKRVGKSQLGLAALPTVLFAITAWFAASTFSGKPGHQANGFLQAHFKISFSSTVIVLRILQGLTSAFTGFAVSRSFEGIQWTLASCDRGLRLLSFLGISPTTGIIGTLKLLFGRKEQCSDRMWAAVSTFSTVLLFAGGLVLFIDTSVTTAYHQRSRLPVVAGTGQFNGSFVEPFLQKYGNVVPYYALAATYNFITNPIFSTPSRPIYCPERETQCDAYLLPGGTYLMSPQPSPQPPRDSAIVIYNAPGTQIDFVQGLDASDQLLSQDCTIYGSADNLVGVEFCLAKSHASEGSILAAVFACSKGTQGGACRISQPGLVPNVSTTMTVYSRQATTVCSASNNSILSVHDVGDAELDAAVNITALSLAVGWLLNYSASGLPAESSINFWFWFDPSGTYSAIWEANAYITLKSLLAFILWEFCTNNNGNPALAVEQTGGQPNLPVAFQTTASISQPYTRFVLNRAAFVAYLVLESLALAFCWGIIVWQLISLKRHLEVSSYPLIDFACKLREKTDDVRPDLPSTQPPISPGDGDKAIRRALTNVEVIVRSNNHDVVVNRPAAGLLIQAKSDSNSPRDETLSTGSAHFHAHPIPFQNIEGSITANVSESGPQQPHIPGDENLVMQKDTDRGSAGNASLPSEAPIDNATPLAGPKKGDTRQTDGPTSNDVHTP